MKFLLKVLIALLVLAAIAILALVVSVELYHRNGAPAKERHLREAAIQPLLQTHATRDQVSKTLGLEFEDYSQGSTNQWVLEQRVSLLKVREAAKIYPTVLYHTTALTMTWLFFDAQGRLQDYYLCEQ